MKEIIPMTLANANLETLQRFYKYQLAGKFDVCLHAKNQLSPSLLSGDIAMILQTYFGCFGHAWLWPPKRKVV